MALSPALSSKAKAPLMWCCKNMEPDQTHYAYRMAGVAHMDDEAVTAKQKALSLFGQEVTDYLIDPLVRIISGAGPNRISSLLMLGGLTSWSSRLCNVRGGLDMVPKTLAGYLRRQCQ